MINKYKYTMEGANEIITKWWADKFQTGIIRMVLLVVFNLVVYAVTGHKAALVLTAACILALVLVFLKAKNAVCIELQRIEVTHGKDGVELTVELGDKIIINSQNGTKTILYEYIEKIIESKNFIILCVKGEMTMALKKDSFVEGSKDECMKFLKEKLK